jgi:hypothetical protein
MSFYQVENPGNFYVYSTDRKVAPLIPLASAKRNTGYGGLLTALAPGAGDAGRSFMTPSQFIGGDIVINPSTGAFQIQLPAATDLWFALQSAGGLNIASGDIYGINIINVTANTGSVLPGTGAGLLGSANKFILPNNFLNTGNIQNNLSATTQVYIQFTGPQAGYPYSGRVQPKTGSTPFSNYYTPSYLLF